MKIEVNLQGSTLKAVEVQEQHVTDVIKGFFQTLQIDVSSVNETVVAMKKLKRTPRQMGGTIQKTQITAAVGIGEKITKGISKSLEKINAERSLNVPIGEMVEKTPEYMHTGTKEMEDGTRYQCKYWCDCGHHGKRWIKEVTKHVHCHECNSQIYVESATLNTGEDGLPEQDSFGNFYIAREMKLDGDESIV